MAKKVLTKAAPRINAPKFTGGTKPPPVYRVIRSGDTPVIIDDGGSTRIRQMGRRPDSLLPASAGGTGSATFGSALTAATIRYIYLDKKGDPQAGTPIKITGSIDHIDVMTDTNVSVTVTVGSATTSLTLMGGITVTTEDDKKSGQRSYLGSDTGSITSISVTGQDGSVITYSPSAVYTMLHLKF